MSEDTYGTSSCSCLCYPIVHDYSSSSASPTYEISLLVKVQLREKLLRFIDSDKETCVKFAWLEEARTSYPDFSY